MDSLHEIAVSAPASKVFDAWTTRDGVRSWWTADVAPPRTEGEHFGSGWASCNSGCPQLLVRHGSRGFQQSRDGPHEPISPDIWQRYRTLRLNVVAT